MLSLEIYEAEPRMGLQYCRTVVARIALLISAQAEHITGQHLFVDGGYARLDRTVT